MGETSFRSLIEGDGKYRRDEEDFGKHGYTTQEFQGEELVNEELEEDEDDYDSDYGDDSLMTMMTCQMMNRKGCLYARK